MFTPITTVTFEGSKFRDSLLPTSMGRTIWTVPACVDDEVVEVVVDVLLELEVEGEVVDRDVVVVVEDVVVELVGEVDAVVEVVVDELEVVVAEVVV